ncbi:heterokaryon incompatibility protein-domain-containing protein, partial [Leptodontidium sp. 2 PMI_412]
MFLSLSYDFQSSQTTIAMGPLSGLVPELDVRIKNMKVAASSAMTTSSHPRDRQESQETLQTAFSIVVWHCLKPSFVALGMFYLDLLIGTPLHWKHVSVLPTFLLGLAAAGKQRPAAAVIMVSLFSMLPWISGSFTRIVGAYLCSDTFIAPLIWYTYEDISDHTEIRWVMIGCALDVVYLGTVAVTFIFHPVLVVPGSFACWIGILILSAVAYDPGWVMSLAQAAPELQTPGMPLESIPRYMLQIFMFRLNRVVRYCGKKYRILTQKDRIKVSRQQSSRDQYTYSSLHNEIPMYKRNIRLLRILKGGPADEVTCRLVVVSLDDPGEFEAISYVWGNPSKKKWIVVDGLNLNITKTAYDIIHRRRSIFEDRFIWIDQVCINQEAGDGNLEKQYQVQMMKEIYKGAKRVMAFLRWEDPVVEIGKPTPRPNAYLVQSHFAELFYRHQILGHDPATFKAVYQAESKAEQWDALVAFFSNPWFRRVWIIQEAVFAKDLIFFYGDICLDWKSVARAVNVIYDQNLLQRFQSSDPYTQSTLRAKYNEGLHNVDSILDFRGDINYQQAFTLEHTLEMCIHAGSTDPRDKIYALLGMTVDASEDRIRPVYGPEVTPRMVYTKAMKLILSQSMTKQDGNQLHALTTAGIGFDRNIQELPSWVPDWSRTTQTKFLDPGYFAGTGYPAFIEFPAANESTLLLSGFCFDRMKRLSEPLDIRPDLEIATDDVYLREWYQTTEALAMSMVEDPYPFTREPILEAFVRAVLGDRSSWGANSRPTTEQCLSDYKAFFRLHDMKTQLLANIELGDTNDSSEEFSRELIDVVERNSRFGTFAGQCLLRKRFCISVEGRMASVPLHSKEGDLLCIINGARAPYVMREDK